MANDKFKGCFIDEDSLFAYDIEMDGQLIAKAHTLSAKDRSIIEKKSMTKEFRNGEMAIDIDSHALKTWNIVQALNSWELDRKPDFEAVSLLKERVRDHLFSAIQEHEAKVKNVADETEKN